MVGQSEKSHSPMQYSGCALGEDTHNAPGVEKEITVTHEEKKPIFQIRNKGKTWSKVRGAGKLIPWKWDKIDDKIDELLDLT